MSASIIQVHLASESMDSRMAILEKKQQFENSSVTIALMYVASPFQNQLDIQCSSQVHWFEYVVPNWSCCLEGGRTFERRGMAITGGHHGLTL